MAKTFAPQFVRKLRELAIYAVKHRSSMATVMTGPELAAVDAVITASAAFADVDLRPEV